MPVSRNNPLKGNKLDTVETTNELERRLDEAVKAGLTQAAGRLRHELKTRKGEDG